MASIDFSLKNEDLERIQQSIINFEGDAEEVINTYLKKTTSKILKKSIINLVPVSKEKYPSQQGKNHAKMNNPFTSTVSNLTLTIKTKKEFNYLYFPQMGEGTSKGKLANDFMEKGIEAEYDNVINGMLEKLQNRMEEI